MQNQKQAICIFTFAILFDYLFGILKLRKHNDSHSASGTVERFS
jgi:hypothetical protein